MATPAIERKRKQRAAMKSYIEEHATECLFCGSTNNLEWHHKFAKDGKEKMIGNLWSWKLLKEELPKCWCLCSSCHTKLHRRLVDPLPHLY